MSSAEFSVCVKIGYRTYRSAKRAAAAYANHLYNVYYRKHKHRIGAYPDQDPVWWARNGFDPQNVVSAGGLELNTGMTKMEQRIYRRSLPIFQRAIGK